MRSLLALAALLPLAAGTQDDAPGPAPAQDEATRAALAAALSEAGVLVDFAAEAVAIEVAVLVKEDLLEYVLVGPGGAAHESLFQTGVQPSLLNAALIALGVEPGTNATWERVDPPPTLDERRAGKKAYRVFPPEGDGFFLYVAWRERGETYLYRIEDLIANLKTGRAMQRHRWVYLGSAFLEPKEAGDPPVFAADVEGNLINLAFFQEGHTLATAALADCEDQSIWLGNPWLLPARGQSVRLVFAHEPLEALPPAWEQTLPVVAPPPAGGADGAPGAGQGRDG